MMPQRPAAPQRRQQTWLDLIPQAMAGVADALAMRPTGWGQTPPQRTNYLGQVLGMQEGMRGQEYEDKLREAALEYENQKMGKEDEWRRFGAKEGLAARAFQEKTTREAMDLRRRGAEAAERKTKFEEGQFTALQGLEKTKQGQMRTALLTMYNDELKDAKTPEEAKAVKVKYGVKALELGMPDLFSETDESGKSQPSPLRSALEEQFEAIEAEGRRPLNIFGAGTNLDPYESSGIFQTPGYLFNKLGIITDEEYHGKARGPINRLTEGERAELQRRRQNRQSPR